MLHYEISGSGKESLVLLHGFLENSTIWVDMEKTLSKQFKLIKIDLPGHGKSPRLGEIHTMEAMAIEVKNTLKKIGIGEFHLLGHSMGGYVTLAFAELFPELLQSITLFFSHFFADSEEKKEQRRKSYRIIEESFRHYVNAGIPNYFNPFELQNLEVQINLAKKIAMETDHLGALACAKGMVERVDRKAVLEQFLKKILLLSGKNDTTINLCELVNKIPKRSNIKTYILDCGHSGHWEKPSICAEIINIELLPSLG